jgi:hypothetical protein
MTERVWPRSAAAADALTAGRAALALPLAVFANAGRWAVVAVLLSIAWLSDYLDGRLARRAGGGTRLGRWDLAADTTVGAGLLAGLVAGGHLAGWVGLAGAGLGIGFFFLSNPALGMLLQTIAYGTALWFAAGEAVAAFAVAVVTIAGITAVSLPRLFGYVLPAFFNGLRGRSEW